MKVLEKGRPQKGWAKEFLCTGFGNGMGGCGAKLLVEEDDLFLKYSNCRDETTTYVHFKCPECGVETEVYNSDSNIAVCIPSEIFSKVVVREAKHRSGRN